ncbi:MAG: hypothetical protein ACR2QM_14915 [Longimicrobiales bacterium]
MSHSILRSGTGFARAGLVAAVLILFGPGAVAGQDEEWNRYTLEELEGVFVRAEASPACEEFGVSSTSLRDDANKTLEEAEVALLSEPEMLAAPGLPDLRITVECAEGPDNTVAYSVWLMMQQAARMVRDEQIQLSEAVTWYTTALGAAEDDRAADEVGEALVLKLGEFAEAFKAANSVEEADPSSD